MSAKDALVLSGGASKGDFEAGVVRRLFELGFQPGLIVATSVGSVNGVKLVESGALATPGQPSGLEQIWLGLKSNASMYVENPDFNLQALEAEGIAVAVDDIVALVAPHLFPEPGPLGLAAIVQLSILGIDIAKLVDGVRRLLGAKSLYKLEPIKTLLHDPNILNTNKVENSAINLLLAVVSLEAGDLRFVNRHGVLLEADAKTPHVEQGAVPQACQGAANAVSAARANLQEIEGNRNDYTEAGFRRALAAANVALGKAQQNLATCERQNPQGAQQVVVPIPDAVLASASIPFVFEAVKLGVENYVDGGVRQNVPIAGAIAAGATNVWAVLANHIGVTPLPFTDKLTGATITTYDGASFLLVAERAAEEIMPAQIEQDNINLLTAWSSATVTIVQPELGTFPPDIHDGFTIDPGLIRIRMAHGYMRTDDVNTARELRGNDWASVADQISQLLFTTDIVNLRYQIWLREHDYHGFAPNFTRRGTLQQPTPVAEADPPAVVLADIRQMKRQLQQLVQRRLMGINPDGTLIVLDRHLQGAVPDQPVALTDWWLSWEAHQFPISGAPWDAATPFSPLPLPGAGHLLEFYKSGPNPWQVFDHTREVGGATVVGTPAIYSEGRGAALHVFTRGVNNHLQEFYKLLGPTPWQVFDRTPEMGGATIASDPAVFVDSSVHVFGADLSGHLLEFYKSGPNPWQVFDHTREVGGATVVGTPAIYSEGPGAALHLFTRGVNNHLLEFFKSGPKPWQVFDHTPEVGGATLANDPAVFVDTSAHVFAVGGTA